MGIPPPPVVADAPAAAPVPGEPEKLVLPARAVERLLRLALRTQLGEEWWDGFATAHGAPSWITDRAYAFRTQDAAVVRTAPPGAQE